MKKDKEQKPNISNRNASDNEDRGRAQSGGEAADSTPIYLTSDSTLQTPEEHERDQRIDPRKDDSMDVSDSDLEEINAGRLTGREPREGSNEE